MLIHHTGRTPGAVLRIVAAAALLSVPFAAFAASADAGPPQQLIVKYRKPLANALNNPGALNRSARATSVLNAVSDRLAVRFERKRTLATGADLVRVTRGNGQGNGLFARRASDAMSISELEAVARELERNPDVLYAEVDRMLRPMATPNDARYNEQWHYFEAVGGLNLPAAWDLSTGAGIRVAVLDTGYRPHADLAANIVGGYDFISDTFVANDGGGRDSDARDPGDWMSAGECGGGYPPQDQGSSWHGTHVAGTIAAVTNNGTGVAGVAYGAEVVPLRVLGKCGGLTSDIADAIVWASGGAVSGVPSNPHPADVINMSLGGGGSCSATTQSAINTARSNGAVVIVAAGNANTNASNSNPANCNGVVTIAATNRDGGRSYYSNYGSVVDVAAPGGELTQSTSIHGILSTFNSGASSPGSDTYTFYQGTSMATPHVAGAAALIMSANTALTPDDVEIILKNTARSFPATCSQCGTGIVDAEAAVNAALGGGGPDPEPGDTVLENGVAETNLTGSQGEELRFTLEVPAGATNLSFTMSGGSGDADLYVRFGSAPTTSSYDCRPYVGGNNENCDIANVQAGTYHVMIRGYSAFSGVSLTGSFDEDTGGGGGDNVLENGVAKTNLAGASGSETFFTMEVPAGASNLSFVMSGGSGDADLYVRFGSAPNTSSYDCRPYRSGNSESCNFASPQAGTWHVMIRGYSSYSGVSLTGSYTEGGGGGGGNYFENTANVAIPDNGTVDSAISVSRSGDSGTISVHVDIIHSYRGDIRIELVTPNGASVTLREPSGGGSNDIHDDYSVNASGVESSGAWKLRVTDIYNQDTGYIDGWSITFP
ncbi:MAG TPA: S8 family serine peptidase [Gammaproteobacteria bacterium]